MEKITITDWPTDYAEKAYQAGYYLEAIQILHGFLENKLRELLMLVGSVHFQAKLETTWDVSNEISLNNTLKALFILNQISKEEYSKIKKINSLRNKVIHQYFLESYEEGVKGIQKNVYDEVYAESLKLVDIIDFKTTKIIEK